jgi:hypothetical protein
MAADGPRYVSVHCIFCYVIRLLVVVSVELAERSIQIYLCAITHATLVCCGQEDAAPEIADMIADFVKSLPASVRHHVDHVTLFDMAKDSGSPRSRQSQEERGGSLGHHHSHEHELGYMEGLGQAAGVGHGGWVL